MNVLMNYDHTRSKEILWQSTPSGDGFVTTLTLPQTEYSGYLQAHVFDGPMAETQKAAENAAASLAIPMLEELATPLIEEKRLEKKMKLEAKSAEKKQMGATMS